MSTTVRYKGNTLATAENQTKVLKTAGKYMEDDVTLVDVTSGGSGSAVSVVDTLDSHGGTIREITAVSLEGDTVTPSVLGLGYTAHNAAGDPITGEAIIDGGSVIRVDTATKTLSSASSQIQFTGLLGEPTSFVIVSAGDLSTGSSPYKTASVVFDGASVIGQYITNTSNSQMTYSDSAFTKSYSNGTLTVTGTGTNFQANEYSLIYTYGGTSGNIQTKQVQVGSGQTSITFTGLTEEPLYWSCLFTENIGTSSGYTRAHVVVCDGTNVYGMEMGSGSMATENWAASYSNGSLTIESDSTSVGGYFHQPGYYQLTYAVSNAVEIVVEPLTVTENGTYSESGKAYSPVVVDVQTGGGGVNIGTETATASNYQTQIQFTGLLGQPKAFALKSTSQISSSGSTTYYYIIDIIYDGNSCFGNCFRIGSTRRVDTISSGYSYSYSNGTLTVTSSASSRSSSPGAFYNGYELVYVY